MITSTDFSEVRWRGHWIWTPSDSPALSLETSGSGSAERRPCTVLFRRTVHLDAVPTRAPARITADSRYALFVNGRELSRGPVRSQPRRMQYDMVDLAPALQPGLNVVAVIVKYYGRGNSYYMPAVPNTGLGKSGVLVFEANLGAEWLVSDDAWQALLCPAWDFHQVDSGNTIEMGVPVEVLDARALPANWMQQGFETNAADGWKPAQILRAMHIGGYARSQPPTDPYGPLFPRTIAQLDGATVAPQHASIQTLLEPPDISVHMPTPRIIRTMKLAADAPTAATLPLTIHGGVQRALFDFGRIVTGAVQLTVRAPAGTIFDLAYTEDRLTGEENGPLAPATGSRYIARGADDVFETFDVNGLRFIYLLVHDAAAPVIIEHVAVRERLYPWKPGAFFESSDPAVDRLHRAGVRTVELNSHDAFLDCPTREQRAWVGDSVVHQMVHLATNCDWRLAWQFLFLGASPRYDGILPMSVSGDFEAGGGYTIPEWSLHWVHGVYNLYKFAGDADLVKQYMPVVERILRWYAPFQTAAGVLKDVPEWCLMDWGSQFLEDVSSIHTAIWARGLREFAEMATWLEEHSSRRWAERLYENARAGFEVFWDEARGVYVDHILNGEKKPAVSQIAGALAIVSELAPRERWVRIMETLIDPNRVVVRTWTGSEDGGYSLPKLMKQFQGIYEADWDVEREITSAQPFMSYVVHDALAAAGMADRLPQLAQRWNEFLRDGYDTFGECWGWGTHVHGWSSTLARDFVFYTLGVTPDAPGYARARIAPRLGTLTRARGAAPTPHGLIRVDAAPNVVTIESPVPFVLDLPSRAVRVFEAGRYSIPTT